MMSPRVPKLLIVANVPSMLREFLLPFAQHFNKLGWHVDAMVSQPSTSADKMEECEAAFKNIWQVAWSRNPLDPRNFLSAPKTIREVVAREGYDLVHVHSPVAAFVTRFALRNMRPRPKVIYTAHGFHFHRGGSALKNRIFRILESTAGPWTDYLVVINHEDEQAAQKYRLVPEEKLMYMPGIGVDMGKYNPITVTDEQLDSLWEELKLGPEQRFFLMIAEFNPGKRHRDALQAFATLGRAEAVIVFAGVGPLEADIASYASELGLQERVRFLGYRRDIPVLLKAASALLLPSEREGLPRSIMEALCFSKPVISTQIRGVEDLLADNCGIMTAVGDTAAIAEAMRLVLDEPERAATMGQRGRLHMNDFDLSNVIRLHEELYSRALGQPVKPKPKELVGSP